MPASSSTRLSKRKKGSQPESSSGKAPRDRELPEQKNALLELQRAAGNRVVTSLLESETGGSETERTNTAAAVESSTIPAGLPVGHPGDPYEREADRVADQVSSEPNKSGLTKDSRLSPGSVSDQNRNHPGTKEVAGLPGSAEPLPADVRATFEPRLGFDLSGVRVRKDAGAAAAARELSAHAFTAGRDIVFGEGEYSPHTAQGQRLLAHELAHVGQQGRANQASSGPAAQLSSAPTQIQGSFFGDVWEGVKSAGRAVGGAISSAAGWVADRAKDVGSFLSGAAKWVGERLRDVSQWVVNLIRDLPSRLARLASTIVDGLVGVVTFIPEAIQALASGGLSGFAGWLWEKAKRGGAWVLTLVSRVFDVLGGPEAIEFLLHLLSKARALTGDEITAAASVLGSSAIRWGDVRVAEGGVLSLVFALNNKRAFTTFHTINLPPNETIDTVVHELTHVFQYERAGTVYIGGAIHAQATRGADAYNYGGPSGLVSAKSAGKHYRDFNREEQAQIAQDYYTRVIVGGGTSLSADQRAAYDYFIGELRAGDL